MPAERWEICMSEKQGSKRKRCSRAVPVLGAAGLSFTVASGAYGAGSTPAADMLWRNAGVAHEIVLREEEISDVTLVTFHVVDQEIQAGQRLACSCGGGCCLFARRPRPGSETMPIRFLRVRSDRRARKFDKSKKRAIAARRNRKPTSLRSYATADRCPNS